MATKYFEQLLVPATLPLQNPHDTSILRSINCMVEIENEET